MTDRRDVWKVLAERGEWRGADEVARRAVSQLRPQRNSQMLDDPEAKVDDRQLMPALTTVQPRRRRFPGALIGAVAFVVVIMAVGIPLLITELGGGQSSASDTPLVTDTVPTEGEDPVDEQTDEVVAPTDLVSIGEWPSPTLDPVLNVMTCPSQPDAPGWFLTDSFFDTLGLDRSAMNLVDADPGQVAVTTPMLRAGTMSMLSLEDLDGACLLTVADSDTTGWALYLSSGEPVMSALSTTWLDNTVPDDVIGAPGEYQQWRIATGQQFNGGVSTDGHVYALTNQRLFVANFNPDLVPDDRFVGGWLMASLAISPSDAIEMTGAFGVEAITPAVLPSGYGLCAADMVFMLGEGSSELEEENWQLVACNSEGSEILITVGLVAEAPDNAAAVEFNGVQMWEWSTPEHNIVQSLLPELDPSAGDFLLYPSGVDSYIRVQAPTSVEHGALRAILTAIPLAAVE